MALSDDYVRDLYHWYRYSDIGTQEALGIAVPAHHLRCKLLEWPITHIGLPAHRRLVAAALRGRRIPRRTQVYFTDSPESRAFQAQLDGICVRVLTGVRDRVATMARSVELAHLQKPREIEVGSILAPTETRRYAFELLKGGGWLLR